ncbi:MAG: aminotransferase class I/II-fold pyridoxal phosphate-dependent enzyme [Alphaproteobacteria bacterium]|nr:aminotransferase class I/II-fold pyridoxal phosphate-dependent enzyme [Alphaproteobacteria bacterium]
MTSRDRYARLAARVADIEARGLARQLRPVAMHDAVTGRLADGREVVVFSSNDYLGLAGHPAVQDAWRGRGAGSSRLISGDRPAHHALEDALSARYGRPATLFGSGWHANLALLTTVLGRGDLACSDALNHASTIDGLRLSRCERRVMPHGLPRVAADARLVAVEGLYSMDGDQLDLPAYAAAAGGRPWLFVDEAHTVGALGPGGRGAAAAQGVEPDFLTGTLGKALGSVGAFVVGPPELRELLISAGRTFIFTTGLPEGAARAALVALQLADQGLRELLAERVRYLRHALAQVGISALGRDHVVPIVLGPRAMDAAAALLERGFLVPGIRPPTVPEGTDRLRITVSAAHTTDQLDALVDALVQVLAAAPPSAQAAGQAEADAGGPEVLR